MAFQSNAFQNNAFQVVVGNNTDLARRRRRQEEEKEWSERYDLACKVIEGCKDAGLSEEEIKKHEHELEVAILRFREGEKIDMSSLLMEEKAKQNLERILLSIRRLEEDVLEILALLLLANEVV